MGTPILPDGTDYEDGNECAQCVNTLFGGKTPLYVKAIFQGIELCPGTPSAPDVPTFILAQNPVKNCEWFVILDRPEGSWYCVWDIDNGGPGLRSKLEVTLDAAPGFLGKSNSKCTAGFENFWDIGTCSWLMNGTGVVRWGINVDEAAYLAQF